MKYDARARKVVLNIDQLSLTGYGHLDETALRAAIGRELSRLLAEPTETLSAQLGLSPIDSVAARVARSLYSQILGHSALGPHGGGDRDVHQPVDRRKPVVG